MNPKLIKFLENLQKATEGGAVQPEELMKVSDAILAIIKDNKNTLDKSIYELSESIDNKISSIKSFIDNKENKLVYSIQEIDKKQSKIIQNKYKKLSEEIEELIKLIPEKTDLSDLETNINQIKKEISKIPKIKEDILKKIELDDGYDIIKKINETPVNADTMIDAERIKNLPKSQKGGVGTKALRSLILDVLINGTQTNGQALVWDSSINKWTPGTVSGGGGTVETPVGDVDGTNNSYTVSNEPKWIVADGITYFDGAGYTYSAGTLTLDTSPVSFIRSIY